MFSLGVATAMRGVDYALFFFGILPSRRDVDYEYMFVMCVNLSLYGQKGKSDRRYPLVVPFPSDGLFFFTFEADSFVT
jgi:hypothetical protein